MREVPDSAKRQWRPAAKQPTQAYLRRQVSGEICEDGTFLTKVFDAKVVVAKFNETNLSYFGGRKWGRGKFQRRFELFPLDNNSKCETKIEVKSRAEEKKCVRFTHSIGFKVNYSCLSVSFAAYCFK